MYDMYVGMYVCMYACMCGSLHTRAQAILFQTVEFSLHERIQTLLTAHFKTWKR